MAEHYERQSARAEVAVRAEPDEAGRRAARARLRARKEMIRRNVEQWLETVGDEECYDRRQWQRQAAEFAALLRGYLPEVTEAGDEAALNAVIADINAIVKGDLCVALRSEYQQAQERAERQHEARRQAAEYERELREAEARAERERREAEREAARQREIEQARERKAITSGTARRPPSGNDGFVMVAAMIEQSRRNKAKLIADKGACQFRHLGEAVASRIYGVPFRDVYGRMTGYVAPNTPQYLACRKHYSAAEAQLNRDGYSDLAYWET